MKTLPFILAVLLVRGVQATAIYDTTNSVTLQFSQPWVSVAPNTIPSTNPRIGPGIGRQGTIGTGSFTAFTDASESSSGTTFTQTNRAWGSAGDDALAVEGCSFGYSWTYNLFTVAPSRGSAD